MPTFVKRVLLGFLRQFATKDNALKLIDAVIGRLKALAAGTPSRADDAVLAALVDGLDKDAMADLIVDLAKSLLAQDVVFVVGDSANESFAAVLNGTDVDGEVAGETVANAILGQQSGVIPPFVIPLAFELGKLLIELIRKRRNG